jgi:DHA1 family tetracycline resistance protein-like MFS transporter
MRRAPALPFLLFTVLLDLLGLGIVVPVAPRLITDLAGGVGAAAPYAGLLDASYGMLQFLAVPLLGSLSDRYGRRPVLLVSLTGLGLSYLVHALSPVLWPLLVARAVAGATAGTYPVANAYLADVTPPERRPRAYGLMGAAFSLGFIAGPAVGGLLGAVSVRLPFALAAGLAFANVAYGLLVLPESHPADRTHRVRWHVANPVGALVGLFRRPALAPLAGYRLCADVARLVQQVTWVFYATYRFGWRTGQVGVALAAGAVAAALVDILLAERAVRRLGERRSVLLGSALGAAVLGGYALVPAGWLLYPLLVLGSLTGIGDVAAQAWTSRLIGAGEQGAVQGALGGVSSLAETLVPLGATALFAWSLTARLPGLALLVGAAFLVLALGVASQATAAAPPGR